MVSGPNLRSIIEHLSNIDEIAFYESSQIFQNGKKSSFLFGKISTQYQNTWEITANETNNFGL